MEVYRLRGDRRPGDFKESIWAEIGKDGLRQEDGNGVEIRESGARMGEFPRENILGYHRVDTRQVDHNILQSVSDECLSRGSCSGLHASFQA